MTLKSFPHPFRALVVGAGGGIGAAFVRALEQDPSCGSATGLGRTTAPPLDLEDEQSIRAAAEHLAKDGPLHLIIDATGILHDGDMAPEKSIDAVDPQVLARCFAVNATGPLLLFKHFHRLLPRDERSAFVSLSARVGSISDNALGGWYGYRASKAALNMFLRTAAVELARKRPHAVCLALHPGTVETRLSDPFSGSRDRFTPDRSAELMLDVIDQADTAKSASFFAYDGSEIPW